MLDDIVTKLILGDDAATNDQPDKDELEQQSSDAEIAAVAVITAAEGPFDGAEKLTMGMDNSTKAPIKELTFITEVSGGVFRGFSGCGSSCGGAVGCGSSSGGAACSSLPATTAGGISERRRHSRQRSCFAGLPSCAILRLQLSAALGTERGTGLHRLAAGRADGRRRRFLSSRLFLYGLCGSLIGINDAIVIIGIIGFDKSDTGAQGFNLIVKAGNLGTVGSIGPSASDLLCS